MIGVRLKGGIDVESALGLGNVQTKVTTRVLRTIDKVGGLDEYLLGDKPARIAELGPWGWKLRWRVMQTPAVKLRFEQERRSLGLPPGGLGRRFDLVGAPAEVIAGRVSRDQLLAETNAMIARNEEFTIGVDSKEVAEEAVEPSFMREEKPASSQVEKTV